MGIAFTSCSTPADKVENAEEQVEEANKELDEAKEEYLEEIEITAGKMPKKSRPTRKAWKNSERVKMP